ncbi:MAG TPA: CPBP family intramembrane glutamic endopeptidase, partial [Caulobacter sp.]|nr:CPBP family intramembrane glutamic endopeptidase [Caulobacter sp.]
ARGAAATPLSLVVVAVSSAVGLGLYAGMVRLAEGRWPIELGLRQAAPELLIGLVVGAAMLSAVVAALLAFGLYDISGPRASSPLAMINVGVASGVFEELIFRAIVLRLLMRAFGAWPALALSAALFGALHLANPNATPVAAVAIAVEAGLMLASFYLLTGRLWVSIGVHAAWNFTQGWIWGARVSGIPVQESLYLSAPRPGAPDWLSGGAFGPEASVPAMVIGTGVAVMVLYQAWRKGNFQGRPEQAPAAVGVFD